MRGSFLEGLYDDVKVIPLTPITPAAAVTSNAVEGLKEIFGPDMFKPNLVPASFTNALTLKKWFREGSDNKLARRQVPHATDGDGNELPNGDIRS